MQTEKPTDKETDGHTDKWNKVPKKVPLHSRDREVKQKKRDRLKLEHINTDRQDSRQIQHAIISYFCKQVKREVGKREETNSLTDRFLDR